LAAYIALLVFFLILAAFFSASETAYMAVDRLRLKYLAESGDAKAALIKGILVRPERLLGVILLGVTVSEIAAATLVATLASTYAPANRVEQVSVAASTALALIVLVFCELAPKIVAANDPERISRRLLWPVRLVLGLSPVARLMTWCANGVVRLIGFSSSAGPFARALSEEEIRAIIAGSSHESVAGKKEMLHNVFEIGATLVREAMIPRLEVTAVGLDDPIPDILSVIRKTNYSRIPVYRDNLDNITGILNVKDLLQFLDRPKEINLQALLRHVHFVPDTAPLETVLRQMQSMHLHMAVVVDEFGGVAGIITLEDLLEEIVGEIRDEHDTEIESIRRLGLDVYSVAGNLPVKDFNRMFDGKIPESRDYTTIAGFLQARTGRLLHEGENVRYQEINFVIEKVQDFQIVSVRVRVPTPATHAEPR
jgi:CBS domain containing-hemolysin-like protein